MTSRLRSAVVASGMAVEDSQQASSLLVESSVSTDNEATENKYNKHANRRRRLERQKRRAQRKQKATATPVQAVGMGLVFVVVLLAYHVCFKAPHDRQRHAKALYERAQSILQNMQQSNQDHQARQRYEDGKEHHHHNEHHHAGKPHREEEEDDSNRKGKDANHHHRHGKDEVLSSTEIETAFAAHRLSAESVSRVIPRILKDWLHRWDTDILENVHGGIRWIRPYLLPGMDDVGDDDREHYDPRQRQRKNAPELFRSKRSGAHMKWLDEYQALVDHYGSADQIPGPAVDYTDPHKYRYPALLDEPPAAGYPHMTSLGDLMAAWDQDVDHHGMIEETLIHFNFSNPQELIMAERFRNAMVPFKLMDVPELTKAGQLWTDDYVAQEFGVGPGLFGGGTQAQGTAQESVNHFFAFFTPKNWKGERMGVPPTRNTDWNFRQWAKHARYADAVRLAPDQPHFYWQSGAEREERYMPKKDWTFISRDLPSFSAVEPNFIMFNPEEQKGIQCRFGERGVVAATHYDSGRNMVGMITGAKRYILSPPNACGKLGIFPDRKSPIFRHSLLNFGHIKYLDTEQGKDMSDEEREWLVRAASAPAVETVLKAGEILYIPSFWFHYIISIEKSAQCNARSGIEKDSHPEFGGAADVQECPVD